MEAERPPISIIEAMATRRIALRRRANEGRAEISYADLDIARLAVVVCDSITRSVAHPSAFLTTRQPLTLGVRQSEWAACAGAFRSPSQSRSPAPGRAEGPTARRAP